MVLSPPRLHMRGCWGDSQQLFAEVFMAAYHLPSSKAPQTFHPYRHPLSQEATLIVHRSPLGYMSIPSQSLLKALSPEEKVWPQVKGCPPSKWETTELPDRQGGCSSDRAHSCSFWGMLRMTKSASAGSGHRCQAALGIQAAETNDVLSVVLESWLASGQNTLGQYSSTWEVDCGKEGKGGDEDERERGGQEGSAIYLDCDVTTCR